MNKVLFLFKKKKLLLLLLLLLLSLLFYYLVCCLSHYISLGCFPTHVPCQYLCSHCGWLLLKCSTTGTGFLEAETNCGIAHILGILLMNSYDF